MNDGRKIPINTHVMAPLGDILHRGIVVAPRADQPLAEGIVCVALTPPVTTAEPYRSIDFITCPANRLTLGWF
jgi:hypothetical protein